MGKNLFDDDVSPPAPKRMVQEQKHEEPFQEEEVIIEEEKSPTERVISKVKSLVIPKPLNIEEEYDVKKEDSELFYDEFKEMMDKSAKSGIIAKEDIEEHPVYRGIFRELIGGEVVDLSDYENFQLYHASPDDLQTVLLLNQGRIIKEMRAYGGSEMKKAAWDIGKIAGAAIVVIIIYFIAQSLIGGG